MLSPDELADNSTRRGVLLARIRYRHSDPARGEREGTLLVVKPNLHVGLDLDAVLPSATPARTSHGRPVLRRGAVGELPTPGPALGRANHDRWLAQPARLGQGAAATSWPCPSACSSARETGTAGAGRPGACRAGAAAMHAAAMGTSVGVGVTGTLLLSLWQLQEQLNRTDDAPGRDQQAAGRLPRASCSRCPAAAGAWAHTLGHVEQLRASTAARP